MGLGSVSPHSASPLICVLWAVASSTWRCTPACSSDVSTRGVRQNACAARPQCPLLAEQTKQCSTSSSSAPMLLPRQTGCCGYGSPLCWGQLPHRALRRCCRQTMTACGSLRAVRSTTSCGTSYGNARTTTALPWRWFRGTSVPTLAASEFLKRSSGHVARYARFQPPTRLAKAGASSSTYPLCPPLHCSDSGAGAAYMFLGSYACVLF